MRFPPLSVLQSASATLTILSKARCVESYTFERNVKYRLLRPWPSRFVKNHEVINWLAKNGVQLDEKLRAQAYPVSYSYYEKCPVIYTPRLDEIKAERNVVVAMIVAQQPDAVEKISCIWDQAKSPDRCCPKATSEIASLREFGLHRDSMLGFKFPENDYLYKIPAFAGEFLFMHAGLFPGTAIIPEDMAQSAGANTDSLNRAKRYLVHRKDMSYLELVFKKTIESVSHVHSAMWVADMRDASIRYHKQNNESNN